jgi:hypothetical protein
MSVCEWQFHGVSRTEHGDGTVTLALEGHRYTTSAERKAGAPVVERATEPCATATVAECWTEWDGKPVQLIESADAGALVTEHCGDPYTPVFQGKGWTVEIRSGYPLWRVTS